MRLVRNPHRRQLARPMQLRQIVGVAPVGLDAIARTARNQRGGHHHAFVTCYAQPALDAVAAGTGLVAETQFAAIVLKFAHQSLQPGRCVRDLAVVARRAGSPAFGKGHRDRLLVNIKADISDNLAHDPPPMHEARHQTIRRNPRSLHIVRRVTPPSGGHVV
jgi:hypothetical protein